MRQKKTDGTIPFPEVGRRVHFTLNEFTAYNVIILCKFYEKPALCNFGSACFYVHRGPAEPKKIAGAPRNGKKGSLRRSERGSSRSPSARVGAGGRSGVNASWVQAASVPPRHQRSPARVDDVTPLLHDFFLTDDAQARTKEEADPKHAYGIQDDVAGGPSRNERQARGVAQAPPLTASELV